MNIITDADRYVFGQGSHYEIYEKLGAHIKTINKVTGVYFAVWAPNAEQVSVVGEFNGWDRCSNPMNILGTSGIWEAFVPDVKQWDMYKYAIEDRSGNIHYKADPFAFHSEVRPGTASKVAEINGFEWNDDEWINKKDAEVHTSVPMSIYEVHIGSWKKDYNNNIDGFYDYRRMAEELAKYVKDMGYTHIELMGIAEHPFDGSWGYQVTGYYAPTSRYGGPKDFMYFVDYMHKNDIGVILDWVPAHFPKDEHGLAMFDGTPLYEYPDPRMGEHPQWGTKVFNYAKNEVSNYLIANALYWVEKYHIDALRVDAVASMLYLDYGREAGQWIPNEYGENKNLDAVEFFRHINSIMKQRNKRAFLIAEESTAWGGVTADAKRGGLGFEYKWNMGWMNDFLEYVKLDPLFKKGAHSKITFSLTYAFSENFVLVLSHDEVVHLKCSMLTKMPGYPIDKFANLRTVYSFMIGHPGAKLLFMGQEFGQLSEWSEDKEIEWYRLEEPLHLELKEYSQKLLKLYKKYKVLSAYDTDSRSFEWINCNDADRSIFSFIRKEPDTYKGCVIFICNFTPVEREDYSVGVPESGKYRELLSSYSNINEEDDLESAELKQKEMPKNVIYRSTSQECDGLEYKLAFSLRPYESKILILE